MLGLLLNNFIGVNTTIQEAIQYTNMGAYHFDSTPRQTNYTYTLESSTTGQALASNLSITNLEFEKLTIPAGITLSANSSIPSQYNPAIVAPYAPLIIKCSDTLYIGGSISANGCGAGATYTSAGYYQKIAMDPINFTALSPNKSADANMYKYMVQYASNIPFLKSDSLYESENAFFYGSGGFAPNGSVGVYSYCLATGATQDNKAGGGAGGCIILYYSHLYADMPNGIRLEYGVNTNFPVERIHANGLGADCSTNETFGGGMLILAARNIILGENGSITADGTISNGATQTGTNYSYFNNIPQLTTSQVGLYWDPQTNAYVSGNAPDRNYYYNDGSVVDECTHTVDGTSNSGYLCGGAGLALGIKCLV